MSLYLNKLARKHDIDQAIRQTEDLVVVLRFGKESESITMQLDEILCKTSALLANMAKIYTIDMNAIPVYRDYFDISISPSTVFFFNAQHMKVDYNTPDHTKFIGTFKNKQDFIDLIETIYRGAMRGKVMVKSPIAFTDVSQYELLYKDF
uniref:Thioredoxin-like protein n=1 Tax=Strigamia maritima TaxID=126957 RepID=T1IM47_STRMM